MSVEDSRLLACPLFWSVFGDRTGAIQIVRNEKPVRADPSNGLLCYETQMKNFVMRDQRERRKVKQKTRLGKNYFAIVANTMFVVASRIVVIFGKLTLFSPVCAYFSLTKRTFFPL
jgi:hypothetical protein